VVGGTGAADVVAGTDVVVVEGACVNVCGDDPSGSSTVVIGLGGVVPVVVVVVSPGEVASVGLVGVVVVVGLVGVVVVVVVVTLSDSLARTLVRGTQVYCGSGTKPGGTIAVSGVGSGAGGW